MAFLKETETKIPFLNISHIVTLLRKLPATKVNPKYFEDNFCFDFPDKMLCKQGILLRLRFADNVSILTMKGPVKKKAGIKCRKEWELRVDNRKNMIKILKTLGMYCLFRYQKYRTMYQFKTTKICVDETPIGNFLELEGKEKEIHLIAKMLGFSNKDYCSLSYFSLFKLFKQKCNLRCKHMLFPKILK